MVDRIYSFLGLIQKSGNLVSGSDAVEGEIKRKKCKLLIISEDASENTRKRFEVLAEEHNINYVNFGTKIDIGIAIGKRERSIIGVCDENFSKGFLSSLEKNLSGGEHIVKGKNI